MRVTVNIERLQPNTSVGEGVKVSYTYTDFDKSVIDCIEEELWSNINDTTIVESNNESEE